jgi:hypothetical protein
MSTVQVICSLLPLQIRLYHLFAEAGEHSVFCVEV